MVLCIEPNFVHAGQDCHWAVSLGVAQSSYNPHWLCYQIRVSQHWESSMARPLSSSLALFLVVSSIDLPSGHTCLLHVWDCLIHLFTQSFLATYSCQVTSLSTVTAVVVRDRAVLFIPVVWKSWWPFSVDAATAQTSLVSFLSTYRFVLLIF